MAANGSMRDIDQERVKALDALASGGKGVSAAQIRSLGVGDSHEARLAKEENSDAQGKAKAAQGMGRELSADPSVAALNDEKGVEPAWKRVLQAIANITGMTSNEKQHAEADLGGKAAGGATVSNSVVAEVAGKVSGQNISGLSPEVLAMAMAEGTKLKASTSMDNDHGMAYAGAAKPLEVGQAATASV